MLVGLCNSYGKTLERKGFSGFFFFGASTGYFLTHEPEREGERKRERMTMKVKDSKDQNYRYVSSSKVRLSRE